MRLKKVLSYYLLILLLAGVLLAAGDAALAYSGKLCRGLVIADVAVGGLTVAEAEQKVAAAVRDRQARPAAVLTYAGQRWEIGWDAVSGTLDAAAFVQQGVIIGRNGNLLQRVADQFVARAGGNRLSFGLKTDVEKIRRIVEAAAAVVDREAVDAGLKDTPAGLVVMEEQTGRRTDVMATVRMLQEAIEAGRAEPVSLLVRESPPKILARDLAGIDGLIAAFSTTYNEMDENRTENIRVAAARMSGVLVNGGQTFSFNERVGLRTPERGYKEAPTLSSAGVVMDWGGGVCQVSSTLYNAALLADFEVVERSAHYDPPAYVPVGQDATVADGQIDLKLKNTRNHAVYIQTTTGSGALEVRIYGKWRQGEPAIRIETAEKTVQIAKTIVKQDPMLPLGEEIVDSAGRNGFIVTVQRIRLQGNKEISREKISTDEFEGSDRIVRVGTKTAAGAIPK
jgi:vancomycin resistance protein YoaR